MNHKYFYNAGLIYLGIAFVLALFSQINVTEPSTFVVGFLSGIALLFIVAGWHIKKINKTHRIKLESLQ